MAVEIPRGIKEKLAAVQENLRPLVPGVRWEKAEKLHITLVFLGPPRLRRAERGEAGEVPSERAGKLEEIVRKGIKGIKPFKVGFSEIGFFPKGSRPRVVLLEIREGREEIEGLQKSLAEALSNAGFGFAKLSKPHITLGRFKQQCSPTLRVGERVGESFKVKEVAIVESKLHPRGAIHTPIARVPL